MQSKSSHHIIIGFMLLCAIILASCEEFLNARPERSLAVPSTVEDLRAILDNETLTNSSYPAAGDIASDCYFMSGSDWAKLNEDIRNLYLWKNEALTDDRDWSTNYKRVLNANIVLDNIETANLDNLSEADRRWVKGTALFLRGWTFYHVAQLFAPLYDKSTAMDLLGIPLKMESDIAEDIRRATLEETYAQIISDLENAADLLPATVRVATRPNKAAAYAALARVALVMGDYGKARDYSTASLDYNAALIDFNTLDTTLANPIAELSDEVLFHCELWNGGRVFSNGGAKVNPDLAAAYSKKDLRKLVFFHQNEDGTSGFTGAYGRFAGVPFSGLAVDEVYLTRAEAFARLGDKANALKDLNTLLAKRWESGTFVDRTAHTAEEALELIIIEREKELVYRGGIRWNDLRRLNKDPRFARTLRRTMEGQTYELPAGDKRYTFLIPPDVISLSGMQQNER